MPQKRDPVVMVVDGEVGAGKSTLITHLVRGFAARGIKACAVPEPVDVWEDIGILKKFYDPDTSKETRGYLTYAYILERSIFTDRHVFMELQRKMVGPMLMRMYEDMWSMWSLLMPFKITNAVYLKPSIKQCQRRVVSRARDGEDDCGTGDEEARGGVSASYQKRLREAHEAWSWCGGRWPTPTSAAPGPQPPRRSSTTSSTGSSTRRPARPAPKNVRTRAAKAAGCLCLTTVAKWSDAIFWRRRVTRLPGGGVPP
jgi:deoxyadenosine/deoxycytidine kinase